MEDEDKYGFEIAPERERPNITSIKLWDTMYRVCAKEMIHLGKHFYTPNEKKELAHRI